MEKKKTVLIVIVFLLMIMLIGVTYAYFMYTRTGTNINQIVMGEVYLNYTNGDDKIDLINVFPETNEEARLKDNNAIEFTIEGTNTTTDKDIYYEIKLVYGDDIKERERLIDSDIKFDLIETTGGERKTILNGASFENVDDITIYTDKINRNTLTKETRTYELRMWISDEVLISDTDPLADYSTSEYWSSYANVRLAVYGYFEWKPYDNVSHLNIMKRENTSSFWPSEISAEKENIMEVNFINMGKEEIEEQYENASIKADMSSLALKPIKGWLEVSETDSSKYVLNVASNDVIYLPQNSSYMFSGFTNLESINFENVSTREVTDMSYMFLNCTSLNNMNINDWDTSQVTNMGNMFGSCSNLETLDISEWNTGNVTRMSGMFYGCNSLTTLDLNNWDTKYVTNMSSMFDECRLLSVLDISKWNTSNLVNTEAMFNRAQALTNIDLSNWDMSKVTNTFIMFQYASNATSIKIPSNLKVIDAYMFNHNYPHLGNTFTVSKDVTTMGYSHMWYGYGTTFNEFIVEEGNDYFKTVDGVLYTKDGTRLISVPTHKTNATRTLEIPEGVTFINENAFSVNKKIDTLILPDSYVITRYVNADNEAYNYVNVNTGSSLSIGVYLRTNIGTYIVKDTNPNYTSVDGCLYSKDGSELIAVPWQYNGALSIKEGTTKIGQEAFWTYGANSTKETTKLTSVHIPASVTTIESAQLTALNKLVGRITITIDEANPNYTVTDGKIVAK